MAYQQCRAGLLRDHLARAFRVFSQRGERHFDGAQPGISLAPKFKNNFAPVGRSTPKAVDQDDGGFVAHVESPMNGGANATGYGSDRCGSPAIEVGRAGRANARSADFE
ncbi:hypothetical protein D3C71_1610950 [compost metagenome]